MKDSDLLRHLLETEQQAKSLVEEAQVSADRRIQEVLEEKQAEFLSRREDAIRRLDGNIEEFMKTLEMERQRELAVFEESIRKEPVFPDDASRVIRETLLKL